MSSEEKKSFTIRPFQAADREAVRWICCQTGFLGNPVDPLFEDRELFADYLTRYYTDVEPESAFVLERQGQVRGYILGCRFPDKQKQFDCRNNLSLFLRGSFRYFYRYNRTSREFVRWILLKGWRQVPHTPTDMAHFHINFLPESRRVPHVSSLINHFLSHLAQVGEKKVYAQVIAFENRRSERMFARYGFRLIDKTQVTKYRNLTDNPVYLYTIIKDLQENPQLYGKDLWKEKSFSLTQPCAAENHS